MRTAWPKSWKRAHVALAFVLVVCVLSRLRHPLPPLIMEDFNVYYSGSQIVRQHLGPLLYQGADDGRDPQLLWAEPGTAIGKAAKSVGLGEIRLYVYPPILADMILPLTYLSLRHASEAWFLIEALMLIGTALCITALLGWRLFSYPAALVLLALVCFAPVVFCFIWGQITILLLFLWSAGALLYQRGLAGASGVLFGLAAAIKLTPAIVLVPFVIWLDWKWLRSFVGCVAACALTCVVVNTPATLTDYFGKVTPSMARAIPKVGNWSLPASVQILYAALRGEMASFVPMHPNAAAALAGKLTAVALLICAMVLLFRTRHRMGRQERTVVLGMFGLLAPTLSPVSWIHAYATAFLPLSLLWGEVLRRRVPGMYLSLLTLASILIGSYLPTSLLLFLAQYDHYGAFSIGIFFFFAVLLGLVFYRMAWSTTEDSAFAITDP